MRKERTETEIEKNERQKKEGFSSDKTVLTRNTSKFETNIKKGRDTKRETPQSTKIT